jgi:3-hydroxyisobutyrate dehydrogenase-like beta-hydroxyacid dehydrogenase
MARGPRVGFIGLGMMGSLMAASLRRAGFELTVWNRTTATAAAWVDEHGGELAGTPAEVAANSQIVVSMVVDGTQVRDVLLGKSGVADGAPDGLLCVDCSTIGPDAARSIGGELSARGLRMLDAPVTGSTPAAREATLTIMVGGAPDDLERARPVLGAMSATIVHAGALGAGQAIKVINNAVAAVNAVTVAEALLAGAAAGIDLDALVAVMSGGSGASKMLETKAQPMRDHDYTPLFRLAHMAKDVRLCLESSPIPFRSAQFALEDLLASDRAGFGDADFAAVLEAVQARTENRLEKPPNSSIIW